MLNRDEEYVALLYRVINNRLPDSGGLRHYTQEMKIGTSLLIIASSMINSDEFRDRVGKNAPAELLCRHALNRAPTLEEDKLSLPELALKLINNPEVHERFPLLEAIYPAGVPLDDVQLYNWWLQKQRERRARTSAPRQGFSNIKVLSIIVMVEKESINTINCEPFQSIIAQTDRRFEMLLCIKGSINAEVRGVVDELSRHFLVRIVRISKWRSLTALRNKALQLCNGEFVLVMKNNESIEIDVIAELSKNTEKRDIIFADSDTVLSSGQYRNPVFGTSWDPDLVIAQPIRGLLMVRTSLVKQIGGWRRFAENEPDWDLILNAASNTKTERILYLPNVLKHYPEMKSNRAPDAKLGIRLIRVYLNKMKCFGCEVIADPANRLFRVLYPVPSPSPLVSIIIPTRDRAELLRQCVESILDKTKYRNFEIIIVDNESKDEETLKLIKELENDRRVRILRKDGCFNWSLFNNYAIEYMRGDIAVLLNNDTTVIESGWLRELVAHALRPDVGIVGAKLLYPDNSVQHAGIVLGPGARGTHIWRNAPRDASGLNNALKSVRTVSAVTGACLAIRRSVLQEVGGIEQDNLKVTWSDADLCLRAQVAGYRVIWVPQVLLYHIELASRGPDQSVIDRDRYSREQRYIQQVWGKKLDFDPYFSPNLVANEGTPGLSVLGLTKD